jgi:hypothetical protein
MKPNSMVETRTDRQIFAEMKMPDQPTVTDFTAVIREIPDFSGDPIKYHLRVKLDSRWITVGTHSTCEEAEVAELYINQLLVEYKAKRNAWEDSMAQAAFQSKARITQNNRRFICTATKLEAAEIAEHQRDGDEYCPDSSTCKHEGEFGSITPADIDPEHWIVDINCKHCGRSGSVKIDPAEINW